MVLHPLISEPPQTGAAQPVWPVIAARQRQQAQAYWLVAQPDHAALSGELAARFSSQDIPLLDSEVVRAIGLHDAGWAIFDHETFAAAPPLMPQGKPRSFIEIEPANFTRAWTGSIERAAQVSPLGGILVSRHFCWLGQFRLEQAGDPAPDHALLRAFLDRETQRQHQLMRQDSASPADLEALLEVLQFCDLLSLFLCCGAQQEVEFPQQLMSRPVLLRPQDGQFVLDPSPFGAPAKFTVGARRYPGGEATTFSFVLR